MSSISQTIRDFFKPHGFVTSNLDILESPDHQTISMNVTVAGKPRYLEFTKNLQDSEVLQKLNSWWEHVNPVKKTESSAEFLQRVGTDGSAWATELCNRFPSVPHDEAVSWCCNMIMVGFDSANARVPVARQNVYERINERRDAQDAKFGPEHDMKHNQLAWIALIQTWLKKAANFFWSTSPPGQKYNEVNDKILDVAALAVAALESQVS